MLKCPKCGTKNEYKSKYCSECGNRLNNENIATTDKSAHDSQDAEKVNNQFTKTNKIINWFSDLPKGLNKKAVSIGFIFGLFFGIILYLIHAPVFSWGLITLISGSLTGYLSGGANRIVMKNGFIGSLAIPIIFAMDIFFSLLSYPEMNEILSYWWLVALLIGILLIIIIFGGLIGLIGGLIGSYINKLVCNLQNKKTSKNLIWFKKQDSFTKALIITFLCCILIFPLMIVGAFVNTNSPTTTPNYTYNNTATSTASNYSSSDYNSQSSSSSDSNDYKGGFDGTGVSCTACDSLNTVLLSEDTRYDSEGRIEYWDTFKCKDCGNVFTEPFQDSGYSSYYHDQF